MWFIFNQMLKRTAIKFKLPYLHFHCVFLPLLEIFSHLFGTFSSFYVRNFFFRHDLSLEMPEKEKFCSLRIWNGVKRGWFEVQSLIFMHVNDCENLRNS